MSEFWTHLHFLRPHAFWLLLALPLLLWLRYRQQQHANPWRGKVDAHLLPHLLVPGRRRVFGSLLGLAAVVLLAVLALAGPSGKQGEQALWQQRAPLVVALDLSSNITAADLPPSRLLQARTKLARLLKQRAGGQVALVVFAEDAFTVAPMTEDSANVALFLDALAPDVMPVDGQRVDRAIAWSSQLLARAGFQRGDILVLTDHADGAAIDAARQAERQGYRVSVLGLGTPVGATYRQSDGSLARASLDAASLRRLAARGGGDYQTLAAADGDLLALGVLDPPQLADAQRGQSHTSVWLDQGYWLLLPLMLLSLLAFRRGAPLWVLAAVMMSAPGSAHAAETGGWWQRADQREHAQLEQGVEAYRRGDFAAAAHAFAGKGSADALYNQGNALAKQGRYDEAIAAYDAALARQAGMEDAIANRAAVERARKQQQAKGKGAPSGQGQGGQQGQPGQDQGKANAPSQASKSGAAQVPPSASTAAQATPSKPAPATAAAPSHPAAAPPPRVADRQSQNAADAAQRQRMQQAIQQRGQASTQPSGSKAAAGDAQPNQETAEQREQRQALQAWLRRVPDDPGGLLRAKFQLEQERRQREGQ